MSDQLSSSAAAKLDPAGVEGPYVVEHYGFAAPSGVAPRDLPRRPAAAPSRRSAERVRRPAGDRRKRMLAAGALALVLTSGIGGVAAAAADTGPPGAGDRGNVSLVQGHDRNSARAGGDSPAGPR
jgi:hypothetical protein